MTLSHKDLLFLILSDERWHSTAEILRRHPMMVHSRVSDLRIKDGHHIEHRTVGPGAWGSEYRLRSLSGRAEPRAGAHAGSPAGGRMPSPECGYRTSARPLSDQSLTEGGDGMAQCPSRFAPSVSDRPLTPEGDGKSGLHGGSFSPSDVSGRPLMEGEAARYSGSRPLRGNAVSSPPSVSGPYSRAVHTDPLSAAPAAQLTAPGPWLQESLPVPGQLTLSEEAA